MRQPSHYGELTKDEKAALLDEGNNLYSIGGRATDVTQLASSLRYLVKNHYPINGVPDWQLSFLDELDRVAARMEDLMYHIVDGMCVHTIESRKAVK